MLEPPVSVDAVPTVGELVGVMDATVAGLDKFKRRLALLLRRHLVAGVLERDVHPPNLLVIGPTGGGKTHTLTAILNALPAPWVQGAATSFTDTGYIGTHLPSLYAQLIDVPTWREGRKREDMAGIASRFGIIVLDEFDKLRIRKDADERSMARNRALQAELLTITEGTVMRAKYDDDDQGRNIRTHGVLHIAVGAFEGLSAVVARNHEHSQGVAANAYVDAALQDLTDYGFLEELVGRFSSFLTLPPLNADHLGMILDQHVVPLFEQEMADDGISLVVEPAARRKFAERAAANRVGARSLRSDMEDHVWEPWFEARPGCTIRLRGEHVNRETADIEWPPVAA